MSIFEWPLKTGFTVISSFIYTKLKMRTQNSRTVVLFKVQIESIQSMFSLSSNTLDNK